MINLSEKDYDVIIKSLMKKTLSQNEDNNCEKLINTIGARAAQNAINENLALKIPITILKDNWVIRVMPDGSEEKISKVNRVENPNFASQKIAKGTIIHTKKKNL